MRTFNLFKKRKTYHYSAMYQLVSYSDGTIITSMDLSIPENYNEIRTSIAGDMIPPRKGDEITITSLTLI